MSKDKLNKEKQIKANESFNKKNHWNDITTDKPEIGQNCIVYDSKNSGMFWLEYEEYNGHGLWVDARKGDFDKDVNETFDTYIINSMHQVVGNETHYRWRFWKYIGETPKLTNAVSINK